MAKKKKKDEKPDLKPALEKLKVEVEKLGFEHFADVKVSEDEEDIAAALAWSQIKGANTSLLLVAAVREGLLDDQAADRLLQVAYDGISEEQPEAAVAAVVVERDKEQQRVFDLDEAQPHEIDRIPRPDEINELFRLREPLYLWSLKQAYPQLQRGFDDFHEQVYSTVRDTVDGKNHIIDETAKFIFLELFRLRHTDEEKRFEHEGKTYLLDEVFKVGPFEKGSEAEKKKAVERVKAAFDALKGHPDYSSTDDKGENHPIFPPNVHLDLSKPRNFLSLIRLLQELPPLQDNKGQPLEENGKPVKGTLSHVSGDILGRAFDVFLRHRFQKEGVGIYLTPAPVKRAMVDMALHDIEVNDFASLTSKDADGKPSFRVCDPTGGSGGFLVSLIPQLRRVLERSSLTDDEREELWQGMREHSFVAADSSPRMVRLARLNMALHDAPRAKIFNVADSLETPLLEPCSFDLILTNPPFGKPKAKTKEDKKALEDRMTRFATDIDFEASKSKGKGIYTATVSGLALGASPDSKSLWKVKASGVDLSVLFLDRCLQLLKPGGRLLMVVPDSLLCNANTQYVREYLMGKKDSEGKFAGGKAIVKAVISLPADTFALSGTGAKTSVLYVQKRQAKKAESNRFEDEPQTDVFMAVADTLGYSVKKNTEVYDVPNDLVPITGMFTRGG